MITSYAAMNLLQIFLVMVLNNGNVLYVPAQSMAACDHAQGITIVKYQDYIERVYCDIE